jgi:FixJ family two-component response regulator
MSQLRQPRDGDDGSQDSTRATRRLVCIVDDDEFSRNGLRSQVRSLGYEAVSFATGDAYLDSGLLRDTACLISDVVMPGMDGFELYAQIIGGGHTIPIIFVTGLDDESVLRQATEVGAVGFLVKPCDQKSLIECLDRALRLAPSAGRYASRTAEDRW